MSTHLPGFQFHFSGFLHNFLLAKVATSSIKVKYIGQTRHCTPSAHTTNHCPEGGLKINYTRVTHRDGIVENSTVRFGSRFCYYGSVLSRFPKPFIKDISWIRNYAMECMAELA